MLNAPTPKILVADEADLRAHIDRAMAEHGSQCGLNHLDVSRIKSFDALFMHSDFNGDISEWDVSNATSMASMFSNCPFNGDISQWNVSKVKNMSRMFQCSLFNGDISRWNPCQLYKAQKMFEQSAFSGDVSNWCPPDMTNAAGMFATTAFHGDLSKWQLRTYCENHGMVLGSFNGVLPSTQWAEHFSAYAVLIDGGVIALSEHLGRTPFSRVHADVLLWRQQPGEGDAWASCELLGWAQAQKDIGSALGLDHDAMRDLMVSSRSAASSMAIALPHEMLSHFPGWLSC